MLTQSFLLLAVMALAGRSRALFWASLIGAGLPDVALLGARTYALVEGLAPALVLMALYFDPAWNIANAVLHNFWLWGALAALALVFKRPILLVFSAAGILHCTLDFGTRGLDAFMQFWPLSRWIFISPFVQLPPAGLSLAEPVLGIALAFVLLRRMPGRAERLVLAGLAASLGWLLVQFAAGQ